MVMFKIRSLTFLRMIMTVILKTAPLQRKNKRRKPKRRRRLQKKKSPNA
jgi:hypothetical protein